MKLCLLTNFIFLVCVPSGWNYKHCQGLSYQQGQHIIINNHVCLSEQEIDCFYKTFDDMAVVHQLSDAPIFDSSKNKKQCAVPCLTVSKRKFNISNYCLATERHCILRRCTLASFPASILTSPLALVQYLAHVSSRLSVNSSEFTVSMALLVSLNFLIYFSIFLGVSQFLLFDLQLI